MTIAGLAAACGANVVEAQRTGATPGVEPEPRNDGAIVKKETTFLQNECRDAVDTRLSVEEGGWTAPYRLGSGAYAPGASVPITVNGERVPLAKLIHIELVVPEMPVGANGKASIKMCVKNVSGQHLNLEYGAGVAGLAITTPQGWHVWPPESNGVVAAILLGGSMTPGEIGVFDFTWDLTDLNGETVPAGEYLVSGSINASYTDILDTEMVWSGPVSVVVSD